MSYATQTQLIERAGEAMIIALSDRDAVATGVVNAAVVARALSDADAVIDGYLAGRYALPLASTPALICDLAQAIALYKLYTSDPEAKIKADYDQALRMLREIAKGEFRLTNLAGIAAASTDTSGVLITDRDRPFTAQTMTGFI